MLREAVSCTKVALGTNGPRIANAPAVEVCFNWYIVDVDNSGAGICFCSSLTFAVTISSSSGVPMARMVLLIGFDSIRI